jgi:hypothetical protein
VINGAIGTHWKFSIDNHTLTVIAAGLLPIEPYTTAVQDIGMCKSTPLSPPTDSNPV